MTEPLAPWSCPACDHGLAIRYPEGERPGGAANLVRCAACGLETVYPFPNLSTLYGDDYYVFGSDHEQDQRRRAALMIEVVRRVRPRGRILDVGAAHGHLVRLAQDHGYDAHGIEISEGAVRWGRNHLGLTTLHQGTTDDLDASLGTFDLISAWEVVEHLTAPHEALASLRDRLATDGRLLLSVPNGGSVFKKLLGSWWPGYNPYHLHFFRKDDLAHVLARAGLTPVHIWSRTFKYWDITDLFLATRAPRFLPHGPWVARAVKWGIVHPLALAIDPAGRGETLFAEATRA